MRYWAMALATFLVACGDGGGFPYQSPGTSPAVWNLVISPTIAAHNQGGGTIDVSISLEFSDPEADVDHIGVNVLDSSGRLLYVRGIQIPEMLGHTTGTATGTTQINTDTVGEFTIRVWLVDQTIRASENLEAAFTVS